MVNLFIYLFLTGELIIVTPFFPQFSCSFSALKSFLIGLLDLLVHKLLESGLYIRGSTAIVIHFQIMTNFDPFQYQIFIQLGIHTTFYAKSFCFFVFFPFKPLPV